MTGLGFSRRYAQMLFCVTSGCTSARIGSIPKGAISQPRKTWVSERTNWRSSEHHHGGSDRMPWATKSPYPYVSELPEGTVPSVRMPSCVVNWRSESSEFGFRSMTYSAMSTAPDDVLETSYPKGPVPVSHVTST